MAIAAGHTYHVYNQGNNHEQTFYTDKDYFQFLKIFRNQVLLKCDILAYCLMPNHFHFLIHTTELSVSPKKVGNIYSTELANGFRLLLSSYAQYLNKILGRSGSLFKQKTQFKPVITDETNYGRTAFHYLHQNPYKAGLVTKLEDWQFSSFRHYAGLKGEEVICNKKLAIDILDLDMGSFISESYQMIGEEKVRNIFE